MRFQSPKIITKFLFYRLLLTRAWASLIVLSFSTLLASVVILILNAVLPTLLAGSFFALGTVAPFASFGAALAVSALIVLAQWCRRVMATAHLRQAVVNGRQDEVKLLLAERAAVNQTDSKGTTALHLAVVENDPRMAQLLLAEGAAVNQADSKGITALHLAVIERDFVMVQLLLARGAAVNQTDNRGITALHLAVIEKDFAMVQLLLSKGAAVNQIDTEGTTPLLLAVRQINDVSVDPALMRVIVCIVQLLLNHGAKVNQADGKGITPLHLAVAAQVPADRFAQKREIIKLLLWHGACDSDTQIMRRAKQSLTPEAVTKSAYSKRKPNLYASLWAQTVSGSWSSPREVVGAALVSPVSFKLNSRLE